MSLRILLVDDNEVNRDAVAMALRSEGHEAETAAAALDVVRRFPDPPPDAVVLDVFLPGTNGLTLLAEMRRHGVPGRHPGWESVPVVLVSGAPEELPGDSPHGGPTVSLAKPFKLPELLAAIDRAANMRG